MLNPNQCIGDNGHLMIEDCDAVELAKEYGTPLYVMSETTVRDNCRAYVKAFDDFYDGNGRAYYASKAFSCLEIYRIVKEEGMGVDVVSGGELYTAIKAGFPAERINFHGNNKTPDELAMALEYGVGMIIVDNYSEFDLINSIADSMNKVVSIAIRIKPGVEAHTHEYIKTGQIDSKFGFAIENGEATSAVEKALSLKNLNLRGIHCHIGSQIFDVEPFVDAASIMIDFIADIKNRFGTEIEELNLGGGFGIKYVDSDTPRNFALYIEEVSKTVKDKTAHLGLKMPFVSIEPGRSVVGEAGITLYTVGGIKNIPDIRTYVSVDGGMGDNIRYALYNSEYTVINAMRADAKAENKVTIAGKCCESGDLIQENILLADTEPGDILAVLSTGAYNYSMASNYNRIPRPAVVMVKGDKHRTVIRRETYDDLIKNDI
ncbi:MAG: diaminopimelate decarboxylase [Clostridia bacterium]|nr:diaminopimelate decarboxylase [Clostridia bacterium]